MKKFKLLIAILGLFTAIQINNASAQSSKEEEIITDEQVVAEYLSQIESIKDQEIQDRLGGECRRTCNPFYEMYCCHGRVCDEGGCFDAPYNCRGRCQG